MVKVPLPGGSFPKDSSLASVCVTLQPVPQRQRSLVTLDGHALSPARRCSTSPPPSSPTPPS